MLTTLTVNQGVGPEAQEVVFDAEKAHDSLRATFATDAVGKIFEWLAYSPNNPNYLTSDTYRLPKEWLEAHAATLRETIADGLGAISDDNEAVDLYHMEVIRDGVVPHENSFKWDMKKYDEVIEPLAKMFVASNFANAGIKSTLEQQAADTAETDVDTINSHAVQAIGAMLLRNAYFTHLSEKYPESFSERDRDTFSATFRQNILATVFKAARLSAESSAKVAQSAQQATAPEQVAA